jgi:integrase
MTAHQSSLAELAVPLDSVLTELKPATDPVTFADLAAFATGDETVSLKQREDAASAFRTLFKKLGLKPVEVALDDDPDETLTRLFERLDTAPVAPKGPNRRNVKSRCRKALHRYLTHIGHVSPEPIQPIPLPPDWQCVHDAIPKPTGFSPKRFISFAVQRALEPRDVRDDVVLRYADTLADLKHPRPHLSRLIAGWNALAADPATGLRNLAPLARARQHYSPSRDELSPELRADMAAYFAARRPGRRASIHDENPLPELKPASINKAESLLRQFLGLLRREGHDISRLKSLADVVTLDNVQTVTFAELDRTDDEPSSQLRNMLTTVSAMARHWTKMPGHDLDKLTAWLADHTPSYEGMVARNRARLLMLRDRRHRKAFLELPFRLMDLARRDKTERGAYMAQYAVAIELLLQTAMRISNLTRLRFGSEVLPTGIGSTSKVFILVDSADVKNGEPIRVELPHDSAQMLRKYQSDYLPRLRHSNGVALFPGSAGGSKGPGTLGRQITSVIKEHTGLDINPHLFRAIAVFIYRLHHRGDMVTMQRVLGDRQLAIIMKHYSFLDEIEARSAHQETIAAERRSLGSARTKAYRGAVR